VLHIEVGRRVDSFVEGVGIVEGLRVGVDDGFLLEGRGVEAWDEVLGVVEVGVDVVKGGQDDIPCVVIALQDQGVRGSAVEDLRDGCECEEPETFGLEQDVVVWEVKTCAVGEGEVVSVFVLILVETGKHELLFIDTVDSFEYSNWVNPDDALVEIV
jgi:hypothetical protein